MEGVILSSLVLFLLQPSQHTEVIIIHDYTLPGVKELVESFSERWAATTILTATPAPDLSQLLVALTSFHTKDLRYMVLLCSANTTWTVFDMVSRYNLESRRVRWLVFGEEAKLTDPIIHNIREGSLVGLIAPVNSYLFKILLSFVNQENQVVEKNNAYISERMGLEINALKYLGDGFYMARGNFLPQSFGIACPSGAPYISTLNLMLGRMVQAGLVGKWSKDEVAKIKQISVQGEKESQEKAGNVGQDGLAAKPLALDHLQV
ncbi:hypothetical protein Pcinc_041131 [Petrolisthes cinctipes]|uniref:Uncharacterized protein n=1 Tax=Petrolisthes cinctipes TaxID=88211 RepID=A0AAE1BK59_PETCI|nr:hypothetical protein Pcinc_041131 [Petrolisthes cinctipes]